MAERFKAHAWKACWGESPSGVRIPVPPPYPITSDHFCGLSPMDLHSGKQPDSHFNWTEFTAHVIVWVALGVRKCLKNILTVKLQ